MADLAGLEDGYDKLDEAFEVVAEFELWLGGNAPQPLRVRVVKDSRGQLRPRMSHYVKASGAAGSHRANLEPVSSCDEALEEVLSHGLMNYDPNDVGATWEPSTSF